MDGCDNYSSGAAAAGGYSHHHHHQQQQSYSNGGGYGNNYNYNNVGGGGGYQQHHQQSAEQRKENRIRYVRSQLFKLGEEQHFHPPSDLLKMARWIEDQSQHAIQAITAAFRVMVTEQPHKIPLIAALIGFLCLSQPSSPSKQKHQEATDHQDMPPAEETTPTDSVGILIVKDLVKAFRSYLDARLWRNTRLSLHLFAALVPLEIVPASQLRTLLASFAAVLEEPAVTAARADRAALCIIETLVRGAQDLLIDGDGARAELDELVQKVVTYDAVRKVEVELTQPVHHTESIWLEGFPEAVKALDELRSRGYIRPAFLPVSSDLLPAAISPSATQVPEEKRVVTLPDLLVPPEQDAEDQGLDVAYAQLGEHQVKKRKLDTGKGELEDKKAAVGPQRISLQPRWFPNSTVPAVASPASIVLRGILSDMIDLYEVNRKEAAKLILDLPHWLRRGTFGGKISSEAGLFGEANDALSPSESGFSLDDLVVETILSTALILPSSPRNPLYYTSLLREIVSLTPGTVAPCLGRTIRTFYNALSDPHKIDVETVRRFADWFAIHLSNFNFGWAWKEWIPDTSLASSHPKVVFIKRIVELEVRLAYFDRIKQTLPEEIQAVAMGKEEPAPVFTYGKQDHAYFAQAARLINSIKAKASAHVILADFDSFKRSIVDSSCGTIPIGEDTAGSVANPTEAEIVVRDLTIQCVLQVGSRSFSHFLNIVERYHFLLRQLSRSPPMRAAILSGAVRFWAKSQQWVHIVVDKLLQYRIVEPADVVEFIFSPPMDEPATIKAGNGEEGREGWVGFNSWTLLRLTLEKVNGRVDQLKKRLEEIQRKEAEELERKEAALAAGLPLEEVEQDKKAPVEQLPLFPTSATLPVRPDEATQQKAAAQQQELNSGEALAGLDAIKTEQRKVLVATVNGFKTLLLSPKPATAEQRDWQEWWIKGWYTQFVRCFNKQLLENRQTVLSNCFTQSANANKNEEEDRIRETLERAIDILSE